MNTSQGENAGSVGAIMWHLFFILAAFTFWWILLYELVNPAKSVLVAPLPFFLGWLTLSVVLYVKRRMQGKTMNMKKVRSIVILFKFYMTTLAVYHVTEFRNPSDMLPMLTKNSLLMSFGVLLLTTIGLFADGGIEIIEILALGFKISMILLVKIKRVEEACYIGFLFLLLCTLYESFVPNNKVAKEFALLRPA